MQLLLDSADPVEIRTANSWGMIDGVTTNPGVFAKAKGDIREILDRVVEASPGAVYCQVLGHQDKDQLLAQARWLYAVAPSIVVKLPMSIAGLQALPALKLEYPHRQVCITVVASLAQAYLAGKLKADVVALFNGPLEQAIDQPVDLVGPVKRIYANYGFATKVLSCGRFPRAFGEFAAAGTDLCTLRFEFLRLLVEHPYTDKRLADFARDWRTAHGDVHWPSLEAVR